MAQLAEQLICNQQVIGSSPIIGLVLTGLKDFGPLAQLVRAIGSYPIGPGFESPKVHEMAQWLSWLERRPVTAEVESSSLFWVACLSLLVSRR